MIIKIKTKPNSNEQKVIKTDKDEYKINLKERAEDNKANLELLKLLRKCFKKSCFKDIKIIKGLKSRNKIVEVKE